MAVDAENVADAGIRANAPAEPFCDAAVDAGNIADAGIRANAPAEPFCGAAVDAEDLCLDALLRGPRAGGPIGPDAC